ncbi:hypothetical protein LI82_10070 [Methanococcoides methylutens]|uniref:Uncharacterized protein n=1 Tax=Methanococcoides methylutens TaxID=2226 RepID=A0A099SYW7_METMT|nr:hypothetical protein LI82_10070 [Methanococcoides methylutens]
MKTPEKPPEVDISNIRYTSLSVYHPCGRSRDVIIDHVMVCPDDPEISGSLIRSVRSFSRVRWSEMSCVSGGSSNNRSGIRSRWPFF